MMIEFCVSDVNDDDADADAYLAPDVHAPMTITETTTTALIIKEFASDSTSASSNSGADSTDASTSQASSSLPNLSSYESY